MHTTAADKPRGHVGLTPNGPMSTSVGDMQLAGGLRFPLARGIDGYQRWRHRLLCAQLWSRTIRPNAPAV